MYYNENGTNNINPTFLSTAIIVTHNNFKDGGYKLVKPSNTIIDTVLS